MVRRAGAVAVLGALAGPCVPIALGADGLSPRVVGYSSISGITPGMHAKTVRARLGEPNSVQSNQGRLSQYIYGDRATHRTLIVTFDPHRRGSPVAFMQASGHGFATAGGVGIGSTRAAVRRAFPGMRCERATCTGRKGPIFFDLDLYRGRVVLINLGSRRFTTR